MNIWKKIFAVLTGGKKNGQTFDLQSICTLSSHHTNVITPAAPRSRTFEKFRVIWLDSNIDKITYNNYVDIINQLEQVVNIVNPFTNIAECIDLITDVKNEKIFMIISETFSQVILNPVIQDNHQVHYIYIFPGNNDQHKQLPKVKDVYKDITSVCQAIKLAIREFDRNSISISYVNTNYQIWRENLNELDQSFMYTQILKKILLTIDFKPKHISEFTEFCCKQVADNNVELRKVEKLEKDYNYYKPSWWYTNNGYLYAMVNKALRTMEVDLIIIVGFFIKHLHQDIEALHSEQYNQHKNLDPFIVYRGQGLSETEFKQWQQTEGGLLSFNQFLSASRDEQVARTYAESSSVNENMIGVVFKMTIDPSNSSTCFANISEISNFKEEEEILFSMHSIFRVGTTQKLDEAGRLWQMDLTLTNDNDEQLAELTECIQKEIKESEGWLRLGRLMIRLSHFNKAQELCEKLLEETTNKNEAAHLFNLLGMVKHGQGEYTEAIMLYRKSVTLKLDIQPLTDPDWADSLSNFGHVYRSMGKYEDALSFYEIVLEIYEENSSSKDFDLARTYNDIGLVYNNMGRRNDAFFYHKKAIELMVEALPRRHPNMATVYRNINWIEETSIIQQITPEWYKDILSRYKQALKIQKKSLPPYHLDLAISYNNVGEAYADMDNYHEAILSYKKALEIQKKGLPPNHPDLAITYNNIGRMFSKIGEYSKARFFHKNALIIQEKTLSWNHPDMLISYQALASVYHYMKQYSRALSLYQYVLDILQPSMSKYHPKIQDLQRNIELVKYELSFRCEFRTQHRNLFAYIRSLSFLQILFGLVFLIFFLYWFSCFNVLIYAMILYICYILAYAFHFHSLPSPMQMHEDPLTSRLGVIFLYTYVLLQASPLRLCLLLFFFPPSFLTNALIRCHSILRLIIYFFK